ncbi:DMT family transporter [Silvanigrella aquatica]|uniref:EamA-like transporter family protein n=1 Tax=Silvanigrella aquatica TaxID=1915309 RepID=A0A1L4CXZ6_9BACT|nr:DMT family transporter [Silvanigrella aquatica]APJ02817.1 hypothetical protein AXG55_02330 [Silvanigrella aquatica]
MLHKISAHWLLGLLAGAILTVMLKLNSNLSSVTSPLFASWTAHGIGLLTAILIIYVNKIILNKKNLNQTAPQKAPFWSYLGGLAGGMVVVLAVISVNSTLGLSGTISLMLVGQILFGLLSDIFGLFGTTKKLIQLKDIFVIIFILAGSWLIINFRS